MKYSKLLCYNQQNHVLNPIRRITSYNVCYTKLLRNDKTNIKDMLLDLCQ